MTSKPTSDPKEVDWSKVLTDASAGDRDARDRLVETVYRDLHRRASMMLSKERPGITLQTTALVNEALLHLFRGKALKANDQRHFLNIAAQQMRRILIDRARAKNAAKRKGFQVALEDAGQIPVERSAELVALDDAMKIFAEIEPLAARVVELRYFGGHTEQEIAEILEIDISRVRRDWSYARAWLHDYLAKD
jgi:RNA polymerase sigma factor (TIGR02999 family)